MTIMTQKTEYAYLDGSQSSYTSEGPRDAQLVEMPSDDASAVVFTVESPAIRVSFERGRNPDEDGLRFEPGFHYLPFAAPFTFASSENRPATVRVVWLRVRYADPKHK